VLGLPPLLRTGPLSLHLQDHRNKNARAILLRILPHSLTTTNRKTLLMFDPEFFPTPGAIAMKMLGPYLPRMHWRRDQSVDPIVCILEPSAGKGDILDAIRSWGGPHYTGPKLLTIEQNPELVGVLHSKNYRVIGRDFLAYQPEDRIDLILMNPPFSVGARHLLHAWNILDRGDIACLLNAETIRNPWTEERKLLVSIIEDHGSVEYLGPAFKRSERPTDVEVALVRLRKDQAKRSALDFEFAAPAGEDEALPEFAAADTGSAVMRPDQMGALIRQYEMAKSAFVDYLKARESIAFFCQGVCGDRAMEIAADACGGGGRSGIREKEAAFEKFKDEIRLKFWEHILEKVGMEKYLTADLRKKFGEYVQQQGAMALTKENISQVLETIMLNSKGIMQQAVVAVFDLFTAYHKENRCHVEGWKTNDSWKVNRKVILPGYVAFEFGRFRESYWRNDEFNDIDRAMCYLDGKRIEDIRTIRQAFDPNSGEAESTFFRMRYFKKGTIHLEFKDEALWTRFNVAACEGKGWLGHDTKKS
jgi:hypothetical protein